MRPGAVKWRVGWRRRLGRDDGVIDGGVGELVGDGECAGGVTERGRGSWDIVEGGVTERGRGSWNDGDVRILVEEKCA